MMTRTILCLLVLGLVLAAPRVAPAQGTVELTYTEINRADHPLVGEAIRSTYAQKGLPPEAKGIPEGLSDNVYCLQLPIGPEGVRAIADMPINAVADAGAKPPRLYVDTDADGDLTDEKPIDVKVARGQVAYTTLAVHVPGGPEDTTVRIGLYGYADLRSYVYLRIAPAGYVRGDVELGGVKRKVAIVDANLDGRYDGLATPETLNDSSASDQIAFGVPKEERGAGQGEETEIAPLSRVVHVGDAYYAVQLAADGSRIEFTATKPQFGTLDVQCADLHLLLHSEMGTHVLSGGGSWPLPAGTYALADMRLRRTDADGTQWVYEGAAWNAGKLARFEIRAGKTTTITAGPPLTLDTSVEWRGDTAAIGLTVVGRAGEQYVGGVSKNGTALGAPKATIVDRSGKELASGAFEYG